MRAFRDLPIRHKLTLLLVLLVSVALLLTATATIINDVQTTHTLMVSQFSTLANVLAANSSVALSVDPAGTQQVLSDLRVEPTIVFACIYDSRGQVVARYGAAHYEDFTPPPPGTDGYAFTSSGYLEVFKWAMLDGEFEGTVYLRASTTELQARIWRSIASVLIVLAVALAIAVVLSIPLQRVISQPILRLVEATRTVTARSDFSIRVPKQSRDELGLLCDAFNSMLEQIQQRDGELAEHRAHLEELVAERTRQMAQLNARLTRSNVELEQFAYIASHDLQEPLRKVQAFGSMLADEYRAALGDQGLDYIQRMRSAVDRMHTLINDLLTYSRVTSKAQPFTPVDLAIAARDAASDLETRLRETGGQLDIGPLPKIDAEPTQMRQVFQNLIGNSLKYHKPEVPPVVKISSRLLDNRGGKILPVSASEEACEIVIEDNGIGFEECFADRIFAPFVRLHGRSSQYEGTGLGLAVCRKIVERHGGTIVAHGKPGEGAAFVIILPMTQIAAEETTT